MLPQYEPLLYPSGPSTMLGRAEELEKQRVWMRLTEFSETTRKGRRELRRQCHCWNACCTSLTAHVWVQNPSTHNKKRKTRKFLTSADNDLSRSQRPPKNKHTKKTRHQAPEASFELLARVVQENPDISALDIPLGCPPEVEGKSP